MQPAQLLAALDGAHPELLRANHVAELEAQLPSLHGRRGQGRDAEAAAAVSARLLGGLLQAGVGARRLLATVEAGHLQPAGPVERLAQLIKKKKSQLVAVTQVPVSNVVDQTVFRIWHFSLNTDPNPDPGF